MAMAAAASAILALLPPTCGLVKSIAQAELQNLATRRRRNPIARVGSVRVQVFSSQGSTQGEFCPVERPLWLPGLDSPAHLNGSLAGDFGFDPLELGKDPEDLRWYVQAELVHARFAMAGAAGILFTDLLRTTGLKKDIPVWYEAGALKFDFASTKTLFVVQLILMGFAETKRYMDFVQPGSQAAEDSFFGFESALEGLENGYPGGPLFNPSGLASDVTKPQPLKEKEIKNGRLAMVAMVGFYVQAYLTKTGPIDNLLVHLSDPWHKTIVQTLANLSF